MKRKVLLIYPGGLNGMFPEIPLPHLYLASSLIRADFEVKIFDARLEDISTLTDDGYTLVGVSTMTGEMIRDAVKAARHIRKINPDIPIVWGGIHPTLMPEETLRSDCVDIIVRGEGELTVCHLAEVLYNGGDLAEVEGISYRKNGEFVSNVDRPHMDLNEIDVRLPYHLVDLDRYSIEHFPIITSRGCPWHCAFCYINSFSHHRYRTKTAERVLEEIDYVVNELGYKKITFTYDDEYFININRVKKITEGILERDYGLDWHAFCRFDSFSRVDDELLEMIERSGCSLISFGGESGSPRMLKDIIKKHITLEQIIEGTGRMAGTNITQVVSFISGAPTETVEDQKMTFDLIDRLYEQNSNIYLNGIFLYTPYPGTPLYKQVVKEYGFQPPTSLEEWGNFGIYRDISGTWHPKSYLKRCKTLSVMTRFPFYRKSFKLKDVTSTLVGNRFAKFPLNIIYYLYANISIWRWKKRFISFPIEFWLLEKALIRLRGFV